MNLLALENEHAVEGLADDRRLGSYTHQIACVWLSFGSYCNSMRQ